MLNQNWIKEYEEKYLAPYAMKSIYSEGREYKEAEHPYRSCYQRDRDRIIHSAAFRRLEYKTQVFVIHEGDYYRTRLTHTLEVAQISRTIAAALRLNVDLTEAIALAHDLGHTPFGHAGEEALNELMRGYGGFNHNAQGLRVVTLLEDKYPEFPGLNLTWEVREGIIKHTSLYDSAVAQKKLKPRQMPTLEAQVVDVADEIAYDNHDLDDGLTSGLLKENDLRNIELFDRVYREVIQKYAKLDREKMKFQVIKLLIDKQVTDLIKETESFIKKLNLKRSGDVKKLDRRIVRFSNAMQRLRLPLRKFIYDELYNNWRVLRMSNRAKRFIHGLFQVYINNPALLPPKDTKRIRLDGKRQIICDYIAAMTDRCALDEYKKLFDPDEKV
ncbi:MAG: deoxyguanosinetriphosphate triphosphohydrolase [Candidatus Omnitrophica bacterium]|nr:deoxyguanosinetriphosphate triphosphohydrolase [Candidatus Omnitrophota bacterium]MCM8770431.1 deoxyguanosinetriphosphate triphosphohydrolase [Candidatus Omnitrophota bacterium]